MLCQEASQRAQQAQTGTSIRYTCRRKYTGPPAGRMGTCWEAHPAILLSHPPAARLAGHIVSEPLVAFHREPVHLGQWHVLTEPRIQVGEQPLAKPPRSMERTVSHPPSPVGTRDKSPFPSLFRKPSREPQARRQGSLPLA